MLYESINEEQSITTGHKAGGMIVFTPSERRPENPRKRFGEYNTSDEFNQKLTKLTEKQLDECIEGTSSYQERIMGVKGIWRKSERRSVEDNEKSLNVIKDGLKHLDDETLRVMISARGGDFAPDSTHEQLVEAASRILNPAWKDNAKRLPQSTPASKIGRPTKAAPVDDDK